MGVRVDPVLVVQVDVIRAQPGEGAFDRGADVRRAAVSTRTETFRTRWATHNVRQHRTGVKRIHHPVVGPLDLAYDAMELPADPGLTINVFTAEPGSASADALHLLASWSATLGQGTLGREHADVHTRT